MVAYPWLFVIGLSSGHYGGFCGTCWYVNRSVNVVNGWHYGGTPSVLKLIHTNFLLKKKNLCMGFMAQWKGDSVIQTSSVKEGCKLMNLNVKNLHRFCLWKKAHFLLAFPNYHAYGL